MMLLEQPMINRLADKIYFHLCFRLNMNLNYISGQDYDIKDIDIDNSITQVLYGRVFAHILNVKAYSTLTPAVALLTASYITLFKNGGILPTAETVKPLFKKYHAGAISFPTEFQSFFEDAKKDYELNGRPNRKFQELFSKLYSRYSEVIV